MTTTRSFKSTRPIVGILLLALVIACGQDSKDNPLNSALTSPVELQITVDDTTGTTALTWTPYAVSPAASPWMTVASSTWRTGQQADSGVRAVTHMAAMLST